MNVDYKEKKLDELIEKQTEEIEDLKQMLKDSTPKLEENNEKTELLTKLQQKGVKYIDCNQINRNYDE